MGLDTRLFVRGEVTDDELAAAMTFFNDRVPMNEYLAERNVVALERYSHGIEWNSLDRFYGPGYERGSWPVIHNAIVVMRAAFPGLPVFYHADCIDPDDVTEEVTDDFLKEMWDHYLGPSGYGYRTADR